MISSSSVIATAVMLVLSSLGDVQLQGSCGTTTPEARACCLGEMNVPRKQQQIFISGSQKAINVIYSQEFADDFSHYVASLPAYYKNNDLWRTIDAQKVIQDLRKKLCGLTIVTYGGPLGLGKRIFSGNLAYDGESAGPNAPIQINRWGLASWDDADIANTIAHEASHRVGLTHPSSKDNLKLSQCVEPPYVIGNMVEVLARGKRWTDANSRCYEKYIPKLSLP